MKRQLVGPVMVKQEIDEAKANVKNRVSYIEREVAGIDEREVKLQAVIKEQNEKLSALQAKIVDAQKKAQQQAGGGGQPGIAQAASSS
jgi:prefoldin beta subunit